MKKLTAKIIILAITGFVLVAGCEEENQTNTRKSRLVAAENLHLKKDLKRCREEIERQEKLVEECLQDKESMVEEMQDSLQKAAESALSDFEEIIELRQENEQLKVEIAELKKKLKM